jgi:hypothetical protein
VSRLVFQLALQRLELGDVAAEDVDPGLVAPARDHGDPEVASAYGEIETVLETHLLAGEGRHAGHGLPWASSPMTSRTLISRICSVSSPK